MNNPWIFVKRELLLSYRKQIDCAMPLLFFMMVTILFPLAMNPNPHILRSLAPGIIWVAVLLAILLSLHRLFCDDFNDGSLEQMVLAPVPLPVLILSKVVTQWLMLGFPLIVVAPIIALLFHLSLQAIFVLLITLVLGSLILNLLGTIVAALTVGLRNSGLLMALILLPLYVPTLIFASIAVSEADQGLSAAAPIAFLGAIFILSVIVAPWVAALALRIGIAYEC